jgi:glycosyltransferase involved in cell wall biosynthesis
MGGEPLDVTAVILTLNEEANLPACLDAVRGWCRSVFVVDSGSTDRTVDIARAAGAVVEVHPFDTHARQWRWALETLPIPSSWVLALDADQRVSPELAASIARALGGDGPAGPVSGFYVNRRQIFRGRWIRHGGYYPMPLLKLFRRTAVSLDETERVDHHFTVDGGVGTLDGDLTEDNLNERRIADWVAKHNRYARLQAEEEIARLAERGRTGRPFGHRDERMRWAKAWWRRLPLYVRPFLYFGYRYVIRLGFLDGKEGLVFHVMQAFWYRLLVDVNRDELQHAGRTGQGPTRGGSATR